VPKKFYDFPLRIVVARLPRIKFYNYLITGSWLRGGRGFLRRFFIRLEADFSLPSLLAGHLRIWAPKIDPLWQAGVIRNNHMVVAIADDSSDYGWIGPLKNP
jgi:hypothetical protein